MSRARYPYYVAVVAAGALWMAACAADISEPPAPEQGQNALQTSPGEGESCVLDWQCRTCGDGESCLCRQPSPDAGKVCLPPARAGDYCERTEECTNEYELVCRPSDNAWRLVDRNVRPEQKCTSPGGLGSNCDNDDHCGEGLKCMVADALLLAASPQDDPVVERVKVCAQSRQAGPGQPCTQSAHALATQCRQLLDCSEPTVRSSDGVRIQTGLFTCSS